MVRNSYGPGTEKVQCPIDLVPTEMKDINCPRNLRRQALLPDLPQAVTVSGKSQECFCIVSHVLKRTWGTHFDLESSTQGEGRIGRKIGWRKLTGDEARPCCRRNHGCVVGGEREGRECDLNSASCGLGGKTLAQLSVGRYAASDQNTGGVEGLGCCECLLHQVADDRVLKAGDEVEGGLGAQFQGCFLCLRRVPAASMREMRAVASSRMACSST